MSTKHSIIKSIELFKKDYNRILKVRLEAFQSDEISLCHSDFNELKYLGLFRRVCLELHDLLLEPPCELTDLQMLVIKEYQILTYKMLSKLVDYRSDYLRAKEP